MESGSGSGGRTVIGASGPSGLFRRCQSSSSPGIGRDTCANQQQGRRPVTNQEVGGFREQHLPPLLPPEMEGLDGDVQ